jgi:UPF0755 protein
MALRKTPSNANKQLLGGVLIFSGVVLATVTFYFYQIFFTPNILVKQEKIRLKIPTGATFQTVLDSLTAYKALTDPLSFGFVAKLSGYQERIKPGLYLIPSDLSNRDLVKLLDKGEQLPVKITFHNARTNADLASKIAQNLEVSSEELLAFLDDNDRCSALGFTTETIGCMFLPNTYEVYWTYSVDKLMGRMKKEYDRFWNADRLAKANQIGLTPVEVSILASIVESETQKSDERPRVAGVYLNRLKRGIPLQADPTVVFAVGDFTIKRVLNEHLAIESPYNTYRVKGLPPGPIYIPSINAIESVLNAEKHAYLFFCAKDNLSGYHAFATTAAEHGDNATRYRRALNQRKIYR